MSKKSKKLQSGPVAGPRATAKLIAAAPELLSAAEIVVAELFARISSAPSNSVPVFNGLAELFTAINRAKGLR